MSGNPQNIELKEKYANDLTKPENLKQAGKFINKIEFELNNKKSGKFDEIEIEKKNINGYKQNNRLIFIVLNRLLYSKSCLYFYFFLLIFSIIIFAYSIYTLFLRRGKIHNNDRR